MIKTFDPTGAELLFNGIQLEPAKLDDFVRVEKPLTKRKLNSIQAAQLTFFGRKRKK